MLIKRRDFHLLDKIVLGTAIFKPPFKASSALKDEARFVHVINGHSRLYSPVDQFNLSTGDSIIMKCENFVNTWLENEDDEPSEVIVIQFYPEVLNLIYRNQIPDLFSSNNVVKANPVEKIPPNEIMKNYIKGLRYYLNNPNFLNKELLQIKIQELIHILINSDHSGQIKSILSDLFNSQEHEFKEIIHTHLFEDLGIEDLAFFTGLSLSSFKRKFKALFGTSPAYYIKSSRLEKAKHLLKTSNQRISDIAYDCGFNDIGYFSKSFRSVYQYSPSEYRKQHLN